MNHSEIPPRRGRPGRPQQAPQQTPPDPLGQPAPPPDPLGQPAPRPDPLSQPAPRPDPLSQPTPAQDTSHPVVAGYDGSPSSRHALAYAAGMARRLGRSLLLVYVIPGICCEPMTGQVIGSTRDDADMARWLLAELDQIFDRGDLTVNVLTRRGSPARELAAAADEASADALVVGAPEHVWHHLAGSVPGWLARHAHCPVIVIP